MSESMDEMTGDIDRVVRTALTMASQLAEQVARQREGRLREQARLEQESLRELEAAHRAQQEAARLVYGPLTDPRVFRDASAATIQAGWEAAAAWADRDPRAAAAVDAIRWNINERFGTEVAAAATLPQLVQDVQVDQLLDAAASREDALQAQANADWQRSQAAAHEHDARDELRSAVELDVAEEQVRDGEIAQDLNRAEGEARGQAVVDQTHATAHRSLAATYDRAAESDLEGASAAARTARQDSAALFSQPTADSVAAYRRGGARPARAPAPIAADRPRDVGRSR